MGADGWTGMQQLIVAKRDFANAPKTAKQWSETVQKRMMTVLEAKVPTRDFSA